MTRWAATWCLGVAWFGLGATSSQPFAPGDVSPDFELTHRATGEPVRLSDFEGRIVVLDFFAYWCAPCSVSSPDIEKNIQRYYGERGGNPDGIPVQVLAMNLEPESPANTDAFIERAGLDLVVNDFERRAWDLYNLLGDRPSIPLFVIVSGVTDASSHRPWEVLHTQHGQYLLPNQTTAKQFRAIIDAVRAPIRDPASLQPVNPFAELPAGLGGWKHSDWFGRLNDRFYPWVFHELHGWLFLPGSAAEGGLYVHDPARGWLYTDSSVYPSVYGFRGGAWLAFDGLDGKEARVFDHATGEWSPVQTGRVAVPAPAVAVRDVAWAGRWNLR